MKRFRFVIPILIGAIAFGGLPLVHGQNAFSTAAIQAWKQSITAAGLMGAPRYTTAALPTCDTNNTGALAFDTTVGALKVCSGSAYVVGGFIGGTVTSPILFPAGSVTAPSIAWSDDADGTGTGIYRNAANRISFAANGVRAFEITTNGIARFVDSTGNNTIDVNAEANDILQIGGQDVNGAIATVTLKARDGITGTDVAGGSIVWAAGRGTGAGAGGNYNIKTSPSLATGTTAQALSDRELFVAKAKALTAGAATSFIQIAVASGTVSGGFVDYTIEANDGTDYQARSGVLVYQVVNKAGTETCTLARPDGGTTVDNTTDSVAVSAGTLTNTFTCSTTPTNAVDIQANAASSLTETTLRITYAIRQHAGTGVATAQ